MSAVYAGIMATIVMSVVMLIFGINIVKMEGLMLVDEGASNMQIYLAGGIMHFIVGIIFALIYALIFAPICMLSNLLKALIFSIIITCVALYSMPHMPAMIHKVKTDVLKMESKMGMMDKAEPTKMAMDDKKLEDQEKMMDDNDPLKNKFLSKAQLKSWLNHFVFALVVALVYRPKRD